VLKLLRRSAGSRRASTSWWRRTKDCWSASPSLRPSTTSRRRRRTTLRAAVARSEGEVAEPTRVKKARKVIRARRERSQRTRTRHATLRRALRVWHRARRSRPGTARPGTRSAADQADHNTDQSVPRRIARAASACHRKAPATCPRVRRSAPAIKAAVAYLHGCQMVGFKRLTELCEGLFGLTISQGAIPTCWHVWAEPSARQQSRSPPPCAAARDSQRTRPARA